MRCMTWRPIYARPSPGANFAHGHTYFTSKMPQRLEVDVYAVHATFQFGEKRQAGNGNSWERLQGPRSKHDSYLRGCGSVTLPDAADSVRVGRPTPLTCIRAFTLALNNWPIVSVHPFYVGRVLAELQINSHLTASSSWKPHLSYTLTHI